MCQGLVVAHPQHGLSGVTRDGLPNGMFDVRIATAQHQQLPTPGHQIIQHRWNQVQAFLLAQPGDRHAQHRIGAYLQPYRFLQGAFRLALAGHLSGIEVGVDQRVGRGIPDGVIHAIQNARDMVGAVTQHAVQATTLLRGHDLAGIAGADGRDGIGELQTGLHERKLAIKLDAVQGEQ